MAFGITNAPGAVKPYAAGTAPPEEDSMLWIDTAPDTGGLKYFNGTAWVSSAVMPYAVGAAPPADTRKLWIDTTANTGGLKYYNGTAWTPVPVIYT